MGTRLWAAIKAPFTIEGIAAGLVWYVVPTAVGWLLSAAAAVTLSLSSQAVVAFGIGISLLLIALALFLFDRWHRVNTNEHAISPRDEPTAQEYKHDEWRSSPSSTEKVAVPQSESGIPLRQAIEGEATLDLKEELRRTSEEILEWHGRKIHIASYALPGPTFEVMTVNEFYEQFGLRVVALIDESRKRNIEVPELDRLLAKSQTTLADVRLIALRRAVLAQGHSKAEEESIDTMPESRDEPEMGPWFTTSKEEKDEPWTRHRQRDDQRIQLSIRNMPSFNAFLDRFTCAVETPEDIASEANIQVSSTFSATAIYPFTDAPSLVDGDYVVTWRRHSPLLLGKAQVVGKDLFRIKDGHLER